MTDLNSPESEVDDRKGIIVSARPLYKITFCRYNPFAKLDKPVGRSSETATEARVVEDYASSPTTSTHPITQKDNSSTEAQQTLSIVVEAKHETGIEAQQMSCDQHERT